MTSEITRYNNVCKKCKINFEYQIEDLLEIAFRLLSETPGNNSGRNSTAINLLQYIHENTNVNTDPIISQIKQKFIGTKKYTIQKGGMKGFLYYMLRLILILSLLLSLIEAQLTVRSTALEPNALATQSMKDIIPSFVKSFMNTDGSCTLLAALLVSSKYSFGNLLEAFQQYQLNKINTGNVANNGLGVNTETLTVRDFDKSSILSNSSFAYGKLTKTVFGDKLVEHLYFQRPHIEGTSNDGMILLTEINDAITQRATSALSYVSKNKPGYIKGDVLFLEFGIPKHQETLIVRMGEDGITRWGIWETNTIKNIASYDAIDKPYIVPPNFWDNTQEGQKRISIITNSPLKDILFDWSEVLGPKSTTKTINFDIEMVRNDKSPVLESLPITEISSYHVDKVQEVVQNILQLKNDFLRRNLIGFTPYPLKNLKPTGTAIEMDNTEVVSESEIESLSKRFQNFVINGNDGFDRDELESFDSEIAELFVRGFEPGKGLKLDAETLQDRIQSIYSRLYQSGQLLPKKLITHENPTGFSAVEAIDDKSNDLVKNIDKQDLSELLNTMSSLEKLSRQMHYVIHYEPEKWYMSVLEEIQFHILEVIENIISLKHDEVFLNELIEKVNGMTFNTDYYKDNANGILETLETLKNRFGGKVLKRRRTKKSKKRQTKNLKKKYTRNNKRLKNLKQM